MTTRREFLAFSAAGLAASALPALAEQWPAKPIRAIVPFGPGSTIDIIGRIVLEPLSQALGQPIVVENRGGAGGSIGAAAVAKSEPDGYTLLVHASAHSAAPAVYPNLPYDTAGDFAGIAVFGTVPNVTVISPAKGIRSLRDLVAAAKKGSMSFASAGVGSATHWAVERLRLAAGFNAVHVPFKSGPEALTQVASGEVDFMSIGVPSGMPFLHSGRLIALAVSTPTRSSALPDVPTTLELGYPDSDYIFWNGMLAPAKTPRSIVERLHEETMKLLRQPAMAERLKPQGIEPMPISPVQFDRLIAKEVESNQALVKAAGLKFN
ncbi:MAG TPA: tripartite tricarboxylate transporter substrate-binding protein [Burkholderiales bacterium]|nr:tripartite tricarboxylate transporter substrate-binding protein [Burkholderiales bacterium]